MSAPHIPHLKIVIAFCLAAIGGYAVFSVWVVFWSRDPAMIGDVIGTWKSFAVAAFAFWIGSSSAGKAKEQELPKPTGTPEDPVTVQEARP